jgi:PAS domain S-box-containing protein
MTDHPRPPVILNVDDNPTALRARTLVLRDAGFDVIEAATGGQALRQVEAQRPDLVLLDVRLPDIDGLEVCRRIKRAHPELPVLQTSAVFTEPEYRARGMENGADRYLAQPFEPAELIACVRVLLRLRRAEGAVRETEQRLRITFDRAPVGAAEVGLDDRLLRVNDRLCEITGYSREELLRRRFQDFTHPDDVAADEAEYRRLLTGEIPFHRMEKRYLRKDGGVARVELTVNLVRDADGRPLYAIGIVEDVTDRRRADEARQRSESRLRAILDSATDYAIVTAGLDGRITSWNPGAERLFGYAEAEIVGEDARRLFTPEDRDADVPEAEMARTLATGRGGGERWHLRKDGSRFWGAGLVMPLREDGRIGGVLRIVRDRTPERAAEERRRDAEERFRATFEQAAVGMAHVGLDGRWLRVNRKLCRILGYERDELLRLTFQDVTHPDDLAADLENLRALLAGEIDTFAMEKRYIRKDGAPVWIDLTVSLLRGAAGRPEHLVAVVEEIGRRKAAEAAQAHLAAIVASSDDAIIGKSLDGIVTSWNRAAETLFGYAAAEIVGRPIALLIPPELRAEEKAILARVRHGGEVAHYETKRQRRDGGLIDVALTVSPIRDGSGAIVGASKIVRDITRRKRADEELRRLNEELERRVEERTAALRESETARRRAEHMETLGRMTGSVAHDINNVLTAVLGNLEVLRGRLAAEPRLQSLADGAIRAAEKGERMAQDLLAFARQQRLEPQPLELAAVLGGIEDLLRTLLRPGLELRLDLAPGLPPVHADQNQLERAVMNLVTNARDAMADRDGAITFEAGAAEGASGFVRLAVRDQGAGMPDAVREQAFEPFFTTKHRGTGLGLSQVYGFARQSSGGVEIESREGEGTAVSIVLPVAADGAGAA